MTTSIRAELQRLLGDYISPTGCPLLPVMALSMTFSGYLIFLSGLGQLRSERKYRVAKTFQKNLPTIMTFILHSFFKLQVKHALNHMAVRSNFARSLLKA